MISTYFFMLSLASGAALPGTNAMMPDTNLEQVLRAKDQALLDKTAPKDREIWESTLLPDAICIDENGRQMDRATMIAELADRPPTVSVTTTMPQYEVHQFGTMATVIHTDAETEIFHGQTVHAKYITTETWKETPEGWRIALIHIFAAPKDPPAVQLPPNELASYVGKYRASPDLIYEIALENGKLVGSRVGKPHVALLAELKDVFFIAGQPRVRKIFLRDERGRIREFVDRREGEDLVWSKMN